MPKKNIEEPIENLAPILEEEAPQENPKEETQPITEYEAICKSNIKHNSVEYKVGELIYLTNKLDYERLLKLQAIE